MFCISVHSFATTLFIGIVHAMQVYRGGWTDTSSGKVYQCSPFSDFDLRCRYGEFITKWDTITYNKLTGKVFWNDAGYIGNYDGQYKINWEDGKTWKGMKV